MVVQYQVAPGLPNYRRVPKVATLVTFGIRSLWGWLLSGGRYFWGVVIIGEQINRTNRAGASFFPGGIDGLTDYRMGESADIEEIELFTDSEVE